MERPARSKNTPGTDASFDLLARIAVGEDNDDRYPDGTVLIPTDSADASVLISGTIAGRKPIALVMPDGSNIVARPPEAAGLVLRASLGVLWLLDRVGRKRDRPTFVPRAWVTEFHAAPSSQGHELVA